METNAKEFVKQITAPANESFFQPAKRKEKNNTRKRVRNRRATSIYPETTFYRQIGRISVRNLPPFPRIIPNIMETNTTR